MDDAMAANTKANNWKVLNEQYGMTVSQWIENVRPQPILEWRGEQKNRRPLVTDSFPMAALPRRYP